MFSRSPNKTVLNVDVLQFQQHSYISPTQNKGGTAVLIHMVYEDERMNSSFVYEKFCLLCRVMCTKFPGVRIC